MIVKKLMKLEKNDEATLYCSKDNLKVSIALYVNKS